MNNYQYSSPCGDSESWPKQDMQSGASAPESIFWVPVLVPFWTYPQTLSDGEQYSLAHQPTTDTPMLSASCTATDNSDTHSDASTDVGDDDDVNDALDDCDEEIGHDSPAASQQPCKPEPQRRPLFAKLSRQQRVEQLRRVTDEFCVLNFNSVDASSQGAVALRMLTILKSLSESSVFHDVQGKCEEQRLSLLGLGRKDEKAINDVICRAEQSCEKRSFRMAFDALQEIAPRLCREVLPDSKQMSSADAESAETIPGARPTSVAEIQVEEKMLGAGETMPKSELVSATGEVIEEPTQLPKEMSAEDIDAMKQRRLEKRQRQRMERTEQRAADRASRAQQRSKPSLGHSSSFSSSATWYAPKASSTKGKRNYS